MTTHDQYLKRVKEIITQYPDCEECVRIYETKLDALSDEERLAHLYAIVLSYFSSAHFEKSFASLIEMLKTAINVGNHYFIVYAYNLIGVMYTYLKIYCNGFEAFLMAFEMAIYYDIEGVLGMIYNNIGEIMVELGDYEVAVQYYKRACEPFLNDDFNREDLTFRPVYIANLARAYFYLDRLDEGRKLLEKIDYSPEEQSYTYFAEAEVLYLKKVGDLDGIMAIFKKALADIDKKIDKKSLIDLVLTCCQIFNDNDVDIAHLFDLLIAVRNQAINHQLFDSCAKLERWLGDIYLNRSEVKAALDSYQRHTEYIEKDIQFKKRVLLLAMHLRVDMSAHHHDMVLIEEKEMVITKAKQLIVQTSDQIELIKSIGLKMATLVDYRELSMSVYSQLKRLMSVDYFYILLKDEDTRDVMPCVLVVEGATLDKLAVDLNSPDSLVRRRFEDVNLYYCGEMTSNEREDYILSRPNKMPEVSSAESVVIMPLVRNGEIIGVYSVQSKQRNAYDDAQLEIIKKLASFITIAAENAILDIKITKKQALCHNLQFQIDDLNHKIALESRLDGLTRVYNKSYFFTSYHKLLQNARKERKVFAVYVIDIDDFTDYNEYYGVAEGDRALKALAANLSEYFKVENKILARYGGGEFIVAIVAESVGDLVVKGQVLIDKVNALNIKNERSPHGVITISVGLVYVADDGVQVGDKVFSCAERLMAKAQVLGGARLYHDKYLECEQNQ